MQHKRDKEKEDLARACGIIYVVVPYWWDKKRESLLSYIEQSEGIL